MSQTEKCQWCQLSVPAVLLVLSLFLFLLSVGVFMPRSVLFPIISILFVHILYFKMNTISSELSMNDLNSKFFEIIQNESTAEDAANFIFDSVCDEVTLGVLFEVHHGIKTGLTELLEGEKEDEEPYKIVNSPECDVFGFSILKKTPDSNCSCPNCERPVSATRFAPHLEKCMGKYLLNHILSP